MRSGLLLPLSDKLETEAQRVVYLIIKKTLELLVANNTNQIPQYEFVDVSTIQNDTLEQLKQNI